MRSEPALSTSRRPPVPEPVPEPVPGFSGSRRSRAARRTILLAAILIAGIAGCGENRTRPDRAAYPDGGTVPLDCVPNRDGRIDAREVAPAFGVPVSLLVNPAGEPRAVDLAGALQDGARVWDLGSDYASDSVVEIEAREIVGAWFANSFPGGEFTAPIDLGGSTLGVYRHTDDALELLGVVSAQMDPPEGRTLLVYQTPIAILRFPLVAGATWVSTGEIRDGTVRGLPYAGRDTYQVRVVDAGRLVLPDLSFEPALRVATAVTLEPAAGESITRRQSSFFFECFGEVARATSADGETSDDFTSAAELRRFGI